MKNPTLVMPAIDTSKLALARRSFLSRYTGQTATMYGRDLDIFFTWCAENQIKPLKAKRIHLEMFAGHLAEERGNQPVSVARRMSTLSGFFYLAFADEIIEKNPMQFVRKPKVQYDHEKFEVLTLAELALVKRAARKASPRDEAMIVLLADLGLRVSEVCSINVEDFHHERQGHRVLRFVGKGGKPATMPLPVPVARALDAAAGDRESGPLLTRRDGQRLDRRTAYRWVQKFVARAGVDKKITPHSFRRTAITLLLDAGGSLRETQYFARHADPRLTMRYDQGKKNLDNHGAYTLSAYLSRAS